MKLSNKSAFLVLVFSLAANCSDTKEDKSVSDNTISLLRKINISRCRYKMCTNNQGNTICRTLGQLYDDVIHGVRIPEARDVLVADFEEKCGLGEKLQELIDKIEASIDRKSGDKKAYVDTDFAG